MSFNTISALLRGDWLIEPGFVQAHLPLIQNLIKGDLEGFEYKPNKSTEAFALGNGGSGRTNLSDASKGSLAIIPVTGPILKHDNCGSPGSMTRANQVNQINKIDNISALIFDFDSPGGMASGIQTFADAIKNSNKPTIAIINDGVSGSAAYWLASQCDEIYVAQKTDMVGSIGAFREFLNPAEYLKKQGIEQISVYAPQSTEKNKDYKDALEGDYTLLEDNLKFLTDTFISAVKEGRGDKLNLSKGDPFKGKMYFADEAEAIGLIDGIKSFEEVITRADQLAQNSQTSNSTNNNSTNMNKKTYAAVNVVLGVETLETSEEGVFLNEDQMTALEENLAANENLVSAEDHQTVVDELATANSTVESTQTTLTDLAATAGVELPEGDFNAETVAGLISARVNELKANPAATHSTTSPSADDELGGGDAMDEVMNRDYYKNIESSIINS
jgi:protease-4